MEKPTEPPPFTVGQLRRHLELFSDDCDVLFGPMPGLTFYRTKSRGDNLVQIEFEELFEVTEKAS